MKQLFILALLATPTLLSPAFSQSPKPDAQRLETDAQQLDHLEKVFSSTPPFGEQFWRASKRVADERGAAIIHALMERSPRWRGEECLVFVPLVALLSRKPALELLQQYERSGHESARLHAREFQHELEADDTHEGVRKYSKP